jgi:lipoate-protein ligase A
MKLLDLTLPTPEENLALDEALLDEADAAGRPLETLRLWEPRQTFVVVGRSSSLEREVRLDRCRERGLPILRRVSGGAAIVAGPGCLM